MSMTGEPTVFPLPDLNSPSIFSYNTTSSMPSDIALRLHNDVEFLNKNFDANSTLFSAVNDTLQGDLSRTPDQAASPQSVPVETIIGVCLALLANFLIGISVILKKQSLKKLKDDGGTRASEGGFGYLKAARWWLGLLIMGMGESLNFLAFIFAPAILVTPLGVFSIVVTAVLSPYFLKETVGMLGRLGCLMIVIGCVIVTLCGPKDQEMGSMDELETYLLSPGFLIYAACVVIVASTLIYLSPKYGAKHVLVYVVIVASYGSVAIMFAKGIGIGFKTTIQGENAFTRWSLWTCVFGLIYCLIIELIYCQKSLDLFNSSIVMSVTYVVFTSLIILLSTVLFTNSRNLGWKDTILTISGFIVNIAALYIMNFDRDPTLSTGKSSELIEVVEGLPIPPLESMVIEKVSGDKQLYEIRRDSTTENFSTPPSHTPKMTPMKLPSMPSLPNISTSMFRENEESNSCLSLISEAPSSKNNFSKDRNSIGNLSENYSQASSSDRDDFRILDGESADNSSSSIHSSCSSSRRSLGGSSRRRQERPDERQRCAADSGACVCGSPLIADGRERSHPCPAHPLPTKAEDTQSTLGYDKAVHGRAEGEEVGFTVVMEVRPSSECSSNMNNNVENVKDLVVQNTDPLIGQSVGSNEQVC